MKVRLVSTGGVSLCALLAMVADEAPARDLVDVIPGLYGGGATAGIDLVPIVPPPQIDPTQSQSHQPHFTGASLAQLQQLNDSFRQEIRPVPIAPAAGGPTFEFDAASGRYRETTKTLGPIVAERPETLGRGKFSLGLSYTGFKYDEFEGDNLDDFQLPLFHQFDVIPPPDTPQAFEEDVVTLTLDVDLRYDVLGFAGVYGLNDQVDLSVFLPIVRADLEVRSMATTSGDFDNVHGFDCTAPGLRLPAGTTVEDCLATTDDPNARASESKTGIGDLILGAKYHFYDQEDTDLAVLGRLKLETGDDDNFLGTGDTTFSPFLVGRTRLHETPTLATNLHFNAGVELHSDNSDDLNRADWVVGVDLGSSQWTAAFDVIGRNNFDGDLDTYDFAAGARWRLPGGMILTGNLITPLNDDGLRSDLIATVGIEYRN